MFVQTDTTQWSVIREYRKPPRTHPMQTRLSCRLDGELPNKCDWCQSISWKLLKNQAESGNSSIDAKCKASPAVVPVANAKGCPMALFFQHNKIAALPITANTGAFPRTVKVIMTSVRFGWRNHGTLFYSDITKLYYYFCLCGTSVTIETYILSGFWRTNSFYHNWHKKRIGILYIQYMNNRSYFNVVWSGGEVWIRSIRTVSQYNGNKILNVVMLRSFTMKRSPRFGNCSYPCSRLRNWLLFFRH